MVLITPLFPSVLVFRNFLSRDCLLKAGVLNGKGWNVLPAGLVHGAYPEALLASTHGMRDAQQEELVNVFVAVASTHAQTRFKLQELKSWLSFSRMTQSSPRVE